MRYRLFFLMVLGLLAFAPHAYAQTPAITLQAVAGYEGFFRANDWVALRVVARNDGDDARGRVVVRPQTSGRILSNAYDYALELPRGAQKEVTLWVRARNFTAVLRVEWLNEAGVRLAEATAPLTPVDARDKLYVQIAPASAPTLALGEVRPTGFNAVTARIRPQDLPDAPELLASADVLILHQLEAGALTQAQQDALAGYALMGGHVVLVGGANGLGAGVLPFSPVRAEAVQAYANFEALSDFALTASAPTGETLVSVGEVRDGAQVLAVGEDGQALLVRQYVGDGAIDFMAFDPAQAPFSAWDGAPALWFALFASLPVAPSWGRGLIDPMSASEALALLPNETLYPPVGTIASFIVAYVFAIAPLNYLILRRLKRQEWAWFTIPALIVLFGALAYGAGLSGQASEVVVHQVRVVQVWGDSPKALEHRLIGALAPRREVYSLAMDDSTRPIFLLPNAGQNPNALQASLTIAQEAGFFVRDFVATGGIFSNFASQALIDAPALRGQVRLVAQADGTTTAQGILQNDTAQTLYGGVLLASGVAYYLNAPIPPNGAFTLDAGDLVLANTETIPLPSRMEASADTVSSSQSLARALGYRPDDLITASRATRNPALTPATDSERRAQLQRELIASAFMRDQYRTPALADGLYWLAWADGAPEDVQLPDTSRRYVGTTLYIVRLDVTPAPAPAVRVVPAHKVLWTVLEREGVLGGADDLIFTDRGQSVALRYMPLNSERLSEVSTLTLRAERASGFAIETRFELWNWETGAWEALDLRRQTTTLDDVARFVGANNAVHLRLSYNYPSGTARLRDVSLVYEGTP
jgi:hypothetical protein